MDIKGDTISYNAQLLLHHAHYAREGQITIARWEARLS